MTFFFRHSKNAALFLALAIVCVGGCSGGPARVYPPDINASEAAANAISEFDADGDQLLSKDELAACPALLDAIKRYDKNSDAQISSDEIVRRIGELSRNGQTGMYSLMFRVLNNGSPLAGAQVELIPEQFLGEAVKPARGVTSKRGLVRPSMEGVTSSTDGVALRGVQPGLYRVAIKGPTDDITERYGSGEELGLEVGPHVLGTGIVFDLTP